MAGAIPPAGLPAAREKDKLECMNVIESIVKDLQNLSTPKLVEVARYVHGLSETAQKERLSLLRQTHGGLSEKDGEAFELALHGARRVEV